METRPLIGWLARSTNQRPGFQLTYASKTLAHDPAQNLIKEILTTTMRSSVGLWPNQQLSLTRTSLGFVWVRVFQFPRFAVFDVRVLDVQISVLPSWNSFSSIFFFMSDPNTNEITEEVIYNQENSRSLSHICNKNCCKNSLKTKYYLVHFHEILQFLGEIKSCLI